MLFYSKTPEQLKASLGRMLRSLRPGGEIRIFPLLTLPNTPEEIEKRTNAKGTALEWLHKHDSYPFRSLGKFREAFQTLSNSEPTWRYEIEFVQKPEPPMPGRVGMLKGILPRFEH